MGLYPGAELVWGIPVVAYDDDGHATNFWDPHKYCEDCSMDEEDDEQHEGDWREFEGDLVIKAYGHYETETDEQRAILSSRRVVSYSGNAWEPTSIDGRELIDETTHDRLYSTSNAEADAEDLNVDFYSQASWWLVASYG